MVVCFDLALCFDMVMYLDLACLCDVGIDAKTGSTVSVKRPANFDVAVKKLGLQHALGSLRLVKFDHPTQLVSNENMDVSKMPSQAQQADSTSQSAAGKADEDGAWLPLQLQLGLPLTPAELCDMVCRCAPTSCLKYQLKPYISCLLTSLQCCYCLCTAHRDIMYVIIVASTAVRD